MRAAVAAMAITIAPAALAGPSGTVLSNNIKDADNTTGQDSTRGSGVKTPHLQNGAVTAPKLAPAAVGTAAIADGAVTAAKLAGAIPAAKIDRTGLDADTVDGHHAGDFAPAVHTHTLSDIQGTEALRRKHPQVLVVSADGTGDFPDPVAAINSITDASSAKPYLVKILPGIYTVSGFATKPWVDVEGAGEGVTTILATATYDMYYGTAALKVIGLTEVRGLTLVTSDALALVAFTGTGGAPAFRNVTILNQVQTSGSQPATIGASLYGDVLFDRVTVRVSAAPGVSCTGTVAVTVWSGPIAIRDSEISISGCTIGIGIRDNGAGSDLDLSNTLVAAQGSQSAAAVSLLGFGTHVRARSSQLEATSDSVSGTSQALAVTGSSIQPTVVEVSSSELFARKGSSAGAAIDLTSTGESVSVANTKLDGTVSNPSATLRCFGTYDANYAAATCP